MGRKIFISYKYHDKNVRHLDDCHIYQDTTVRNYVDTLEAYLKQTDNIYKGEANNEDLSLDKDETIWEKLKDRLYDSSVTIVMISKGMKRKQAKERNQWIPWEISYSLRETERSDRTSHSNAILAVVLPDKQKENEYDYFFTYEPCGLTIYHIENTFQIIKKNMFNMKYASSYKCGVCGNTHYDEICSYITAVKWDDFIKSPQQYIDKACERQKNISDYNISVDL